MDKLKIDNFLSEYKRPFVEFRSLGMEECAYIRSTLSGKIGSSIDDHFGLVKAIDKAQNILPIEIPEEESTGVRGFALERVFAALKIEKQLDEPLLVNWRHYDNIDELSLGDLSNYFYDIWYRALDDIDILDSSCQWVLSISHNGVIKFISLG